MFRSLVVSIVVFLFLWSIAFVNVSFSYILKGTDSIWIQDTVKRDTLVIDTVSIISELLTADSMFRLKQKDHRIIYLNGDNKKPFQINPLGGILININKVFSHFSKQGKQARRLQHVFNEEYKNDLVNGIWKPYSEKYTDLKGDSLFVFQTYFQPDYKSFNSATHYEKLYYIIQSIRVYRDSTDMIHDAMRLPKIHLR